MSSDEELMAAYAAGEEGALRELFGRYAQLLMRLMLRDLRSPEEAKDLVQQTFLQLHRARLDFDPSQPFRPWLFTIALNLKRESFRRQRRRPETPLEEDHSGALDIGADAHEQAETERTLRWALSRLTPAHRDVIELHWLGGLSFAEVAACLRITASAAKVRAHRGYLRLRELLGDGIEER